MNNYNIEQIPFVDLKRAFMCHKDEYEAAIINTLRSGYYVLGDAVKEFEENFASYINMRYGIGVNSGQDALTLAVRALGIGLGDEVIVQANAYIASVLAITENGAKPVFVEADDFFGIDCNAIEKAITNRTKAILPVHLYGQPCDMKQISSIARKYNLYIIEDCAQCHGSRCGDKISGSFSDISCFSFYPTKPLGAFGDGGICLTNNAQLKDRLQMLRFYGSIKKYESAIEGVNSRLDEIQAAVLSIRLHYLEEDNITRQKIAERYLMEISNPRVKLPKIRRDSTHVFHIFAVLCEDRDNLATHLFNQGIDSGIHYPIPPHLQKCYQHLGYKEGDFPIAEKQAKEELSLPIYIGMTESDIDRVIDAVNSFKG